MRRVVTGTDSTGKAAIVSDTEIAPDGISLMPGAEFLSIWGSDTPPRLPNDGSRPTGRDWFPPATGYRVQEITIPPASAHPPPGLDLTAAVAEADARLPGLLGHMDPAHPGMHRTDTVDFVYILSGRCVLELDGGTTTPLGPGDVVVQNGVRHAWRVPYGEPCRVLSISLGAVRD